MMWPTEQNVPNLELVQLSRGRLIAIVASFIVGATLFIVAVTSSSPGTGSALPRLRSPIGAVFHRPVELLGACAEWRIDRGHDVDPNGLVDQENDECLPSQHANRTARGRLTTSRTNGS